MKAIQGITKHCGHRGIWMMDRAGDRKNLIKPLLNADLRFILRQRRDRTIRYRGTEHIMNKVADACPYPYAEKIILEEEGKEKSYQISFGFRKIKRK